jgi:hypothetical protein
LIQLPAPSGSETDRVERKREVVDEKKSPKYETPEVITYTEEEILEELGTAQASPPWKPLPPISVGK